MAANCVFVGLIHITYLICHTCMNLKACGSYSLYPPWFVVLAVTAHVHNNQTINSISYLNIYIPPYILTTYLHRISIETESINLPMG